MTTTTATEIAFSADGIKMTRKHRHKLNRKLLLLTDFPDSHIFEL